MTQPPPPSNEPQSDGRLDVRLESTLNALDDAIGLLSELDGASTPRGGRRGRIDLAALLYEVAPSARISIEPGAGTEVFGEETDLRRLLHVLVSLSASPATGQASGPAEVQVRRDGEWVRVSVNLGPDISGSVELERRWLSRMATRLGGRLDLEGGMVSILFPADAAVDHGEVADLKKELEQAQQLGEIYARELASVFDSSARPIPPREPERHEVSESRFEVLLNLASGLRSMLRGLTDKLQEDASFARSSLGDGAPLTRALDKRFTTASEIIGELNRIADCPLNEAPIVVDLTALIREVVQRAERRSRRHAVQVIFHGSEPIAVRTRCACFELVVRALLDHAIEATPRQGLVKLGIVESESHIVLVVEDGGPVVPMSNVAALLDGRLDPSSVGRPSGIALLVATTAAGRLGATLSLGESEGGAAEMIVTLPKA